MDSSRSMLFAACALAVFLPATAFAIIISPGHHPLRTVTPAIVDFGGRPIPPWAFDPGSDPFVGQVEMKGVPLTSGPICVLTLPGNTDTVIERKQAADLPNIGDSSTVPIELVQLSLVSVNPITVTYNGGLNPELWNVKIAPCTSVLHAGSMTITKTHPNGGTFTAEFTVQPIFTFTRISDGAVRVRDDIMIIDFVCPPTPWVHDPAPLQCPICGTTNFFPGVSNGNMVAWTMQATNAVQTVAPICTAPVGLEQASWGAVKAMYRE